MGSADSDNVRDLVSERDTVRVTEGDRVALGDGVDDGESEVEAEVSDVNDVDGESVNEVDDVLEGVSVRDADLSSVTDCVRENVREEVSVVDVLISAVKERVLLFVNVTVVVGVHDSDWVIDDEYVSDTPSLGDTDTDIDRGMLSLLDALT